MTTDSKPTKAAPGSPFAAPVRPNNTRRPTPPPTAARPDPDAAPPPPPPATAPEVPEGPGPTDPTPVPPPVEQTPQAAPPAAPPPAPGPASAVAQPGSGTLASVLTAPNHHHHSVSEGVAALAGLASMANRPVDPMKDWVGDGTRLTRWMALSVRQYALLTGRKTQDVMRDALLGKDPIPDDVLDANWLNCYGYPREQYNPEAYR